MKERKKKKKEDKQVSLCVCVCGLWWRLFDLKRVFSPRPCHFIPFFFCFAPGRTTQFCSTITMKPQQKRKKKNFYRRRGTLKNNKFHSPSKLGNQ